MKSKKIIVLFAACALCLVPFAQDLHFSQFMNSPLTTNPANTGFIPDGDYRLGINYRNQWSSIMAVPYKTMSAFGDAQLMQNQSNTGWLGVGGVDSYGMWPAAAILLLQKYMARLLITRCLMQEVLLVQDLMWAGPINRSMYQS